VVKLVKKIEAKNIEDINAITKTLTAVVEKLKEDTGSNVEELKKQAMAYCEQETERLKKQHEQMMGMVEQKMAEVQNGLDGKDADEERIINDVIEKVQVPVLDKLGKSLPTLGIAIRDGLELLNGNERLDASAIKNLEEFLSKRETRVVSGGFNYGAIDLHFADPYTPTGLVDGINKDFELNNVPNPASSLKVWCDGQKKQLATDYTLSGTTISFIDAPLIDTIIEVEHRI
jgi:ElaB/YqjD/DUF883 family membrane-anchored ribosome-binding protein